MKRKEKKKKERKRIEMKRTAIHTYIHIYDI